MTVVEMIETRKPKARHNMDAAMIPEVSAPGMLSPLDRAMTRLKEHEPSGSLHALRYWAGFTPIPSFEDSAVPRIMCGSGGDSTLTTLIDVREEDTDCGTDLSVFPSHNELIATIRSSLSLQIKELAEILRIQRPTVYSWIKDEVEPSATNRDRLQQLYRIALKWKRLCNLPAERLIRSAGADGHSVLDLLKADEINDAKVMSRIESLARARLKMKREADEKRPTADAIAQRFGLATDDISDQQDLIDAGTGKRSSPD